MRHAGVVIASRGAPWMRRLPDMDPPTLRVSLLGGFELVQGSEPVRVESGRLRSLIAWLALHLEGPQPRQRVAAELWPESTDGQARTNLRNLIHQLRRTLPEIDRYLDTGGAFLEWLPGAPVSVDVAQFERAFSEASASTVPETRTFGALEDALVLYRGPLLPDCYEPWIAGEQARLARVHLSGLEALLERYLEHEDFARARDVAERILRYDALSERAHRTRIMALAALGDRAGALRAYHECESLLAAELGVAPSRATQRAYRAALGAGSLAETAARSIADVGTDPAGAPDAGSTASERGSAGRTADEAPRRTDESRRTEDGRLDVRQQDHAAIAQTPREWSFVGRRRERSALRHLWARTMEAESRIVWVTGEPGIGKTRLVQSLTEWLRRQGHRSVQARAYPSLGALAYGPVVTWLRSPELIPAIAAATPAVRMELARLLPELESVGPGTAGGAMATPGANADLVNGGGPDPEPDTFPDPLTDQLTEAERRRRIHDAVITTLSLPGGPSTLILDDLHWSDRETIDLVHALVLRAMRPLLVIATVRAGDVGPDHPLVSVGTTLAAAGRLDRIEIEALGFDETAQLVRALTERPVTDDAVRALHRESEGNPLFIIEMVRGEWPWTGGERSRADGALSPRIRAVIEARLSPLSAEARTVTQLASAIGREFSLPLLLRAAPLDETSTLRGLDEAWRRRLVRERGDGAYDFSHDKIREVAYRTTSPIRRQAYHARLATVLEEAWAEAGGDPGATLDQIALHHDRGGAVAKAVAWYRQAARAAAEVSALDAVRQLLGRALVLIERLPGGRERDRDELDMRLSFGSVLVALEGYGRPQTVETYERARELCMRLDRPVTSPILRALALAALARGDLDAGSRFGHELAATAERENDDLARVEGAYVSGVMAFWRGDLKESERRLTESLAAYRPERHRDHVLLYAQDPKVVCLSRLAWTLWHRGRVASALVTRDEAIALAERQGDAFGLAYTLWFTLFLPVEHGDIERLDAQSHALARVAADHQLPYMATVAEGFLGYLQALQGEAREGIGRMRATLADPRWHGMEYVLKLQTLYLLARAAAGAGDARTARETVQDALAYVGPARSIWKAGFHHLEARITGAEDRSGERALPAFDRALQTARGYGSAWTELGVAVDLGRWCLDRGVGDRVQACRDLERALVPYTDAPNLPAVAAGRILFERLSREESS
jgi:DNA-binding SARP family transcriptional activator